MGGGHTHALVLRMLGMKPIPGARLTLINPGPTAPYTGMLPGHVAGHYDRDTLDIDLVRLARFADARLILGRADAIDRAAGRVHVEGFGAVGYDIASLDIGITSDVPSIPGFSDHAIAAKPLGPFAEAWRVFREGTGSAEIAIIGGGVGGVELSMAMAHAMRQARRPARITVIDRDTILPGARHRVTATLRGALVRFGIDVVEGADVSGIRADAVRLSDGREIPSRFTVSAAGARPQDWLAETGLDLTDGFVTVDRYLRTTTDEAVYAAGDCAHLRHAPRPKAGVYAVRAAPVLEANLRAAATGSARKVFEPQGDYLKLISLGGKSALGEKWGAALSGPWVWRLKDRIDHRFMSRLKDLPAMETDPGAPEQPLCGGCGAKVGPATLRDVLARTHGARRDDVIAGPGDDAAILRVGGAHQVVTTDHLRAFSADPRVMGRIAAVHALGDIWAMGASPQAALAQIILPEMTEALQARTLEEVLSGANAVFGPEETALAGGHTTLGAEMTIGFTITGLADTPVTQAGAKPGDRLVLTRPVGAGTILAAEMQLEARGRDVAACLATMMQSQGPAAHALRRAHAMTDVTGFGLAGHLLSMLDASGVGATLTLADVPLYDGAAELAADGVRSTLYPANRAAAGHRADVPDTPEARLLFDPQTAGGLLAALAPADVAVARDEIAKAGGTLWDIGEVTEGPPRLQVR